MKILQDMDLFYGTYLSYLIKKKLLQSDSGLTVKQIEQDLHDYPTRREKVNFRNRIRLSLRTLHEQGVVMREEIKGCNNLTAHKYKSNV